MGPSFKPSGLHLFPFCASVSRSNALEQWRHRFRRIRIGIGRQSCESRQRKCKCRCIDISASQRFLATLHRRGGDDGSGNEGMGNGYQNVMKRVGNLRKTFAPLGTFLAAEPKEKIEKNNNFRSLNVLMPAHLIRGFR